MPLTEEQYIEWEGNIQNTFDVAVKAEPDYNAMVFNMPKSTRAAEHHRGLGALGMMQEFNGALNYDTIAKGFPKEYRHVPYTNALEVQWTLFEDKEYEEIKAKINDLSDSTYNTLQYHGASVFNNAFDSTVTGPDGVALCATNHHLRADSTDDHQSNTGTADMDIDAITDIQKAGMQMVDDRGNLMPINYDTIICGAHWMDTAKKIVGSEKEPFTTDNQINTHKSLKLIVNPWITGKKWFMASMKLVKGGNGLNFYLRQDPRNLERASDFDALILKWRVVGRWSYGWNRHYCIYGQNPA